MNAMLHSFHEQPIDFNQQQPQPLSGSRVEHYIGVNTERIQNIFLPT